jgi:uncharacterized membrane protein YdfJ with MMPL/SSD domain
MESTLNTLLIFVFFAPMALIVAVNLLTARTLGPSIAASTGPRVASNPKPTHRTYTPVANQQRYLEAA